MYCSVVGCYNHKYRNRDKKFYSYPTDKRRLLIWVKRTNLEFLEKIHSPSLRHHVVCSDHFSVGDFQTPEKRKLNRNALPSLKLPDFGVKGRERLFAIGKRVRTAKIHQRDNRGIEKKN